MLTDEQIKKIVEQVEEAVQVGGPSDASENYADDTSPPNFEVHSEVAKDKSHITVEIMLGPQFKPNPNLEKKDGGNV